MLIRPGALMSRRAAAAASLLLDTYSGAAGAWSVARKLRTAYSGSAIRVRESGGDTEADIGFDGNGDLDEAALTSHTGSNDGFVVKVYDQSGNSIDCTQSTAAQQPKIVSSGSVIKENGKPAIQFTGDTVDNFLTTGGLTISATGDNYVCVFAAVARFTGATVFVGDNVVPFGLFPGTSTNDRRIIELSFEDTELVTRLQGGNTIFDAGDGKAQAIAAIAHLSTESEFEGWLNGSSLGVSSSSASLDLNIQADSGYCIGLGKAATYDGTSGGFFEGTWQESIVWESDVWSNIGAIGSNQNDYYSVY